LLNSLFLFPMPLFSSVSTISAEERSASALKEPQGGAATSCF
jgi:hypothetical protein